MQEKYKYKFFKDDNIFEFMNVNISDFPIVICNIVHTVFKCYFFAKSYTLTLLLKKKHFLNTFPFPR